MDYTNVYQGWIYCITNIVNGKMYIGQTIDYERRKWEHLDRKVKGCPVLHNAILKYGAENFTMEPIVTFTAINKSVCTDILNTLEIYYIELYGTCNHNIGYNLTKGGGGRAGFKLSEETIRRIAEKNRGRKASDETKKKLSEIMKDAPYRLKAEDLNKPVLLYNLDGTFFREFCSINDAILGIGKSLKQKHTVFDSLKNLESKAHGYLWRYKTTNLFPIFIEPYKDPRSKKVYHYSVNNQLLGEYISPKEAAKKSGISIKTIHSSIACSRKKLRGDYWSYDAPAA